MSAVPIVTQDAAWWAGTSNPATSVTRYTKETRTYEPQTTGSAYMVLPSEILTESWEATGATDWNLQDAAHVSVVGAPGPGALPALGTGTWAYFQWDTYGNLTNRSIWTGASQNQPFVQDVLILTYVPADTTLWHVGLLKERQAKQYTWPGAMPPYSTTTYTYTPAGLPSVTTYEPTGAPDVNETVTNTYDGNGRLLSTIATTPDETLPRSTRYAYADMSGEGVYPSETWNAAGLATFFWTNPALGVSEGMMDSNGVQTTYVHDDLGRIVETMFPGGDVESVALSPALEYDTVIGVQRSSSKASGSQSTVTSDPYEERFGQGSNGGNLHVFNVGGLAQVVYDDGLGTEKTEYFHTDQNNGSLSLVTNDGGGMVASYYHEPFGKRINVTGAPLTSYASDVRGIFAGHDYDDDLGYINMKGRMYDPTLRRFLTTDPLVSNPLDAQAYNRYSYVSNDPVNRADPSGFFYCDNCVGDGVGGDDSGGDSSSDCSRARALPRRACPLGLRLPSPDRLTTLPCRSETRMPTGHR